MAVKGNSKASVQSTIQFSGSGSYLDPFIIVDSESGIQPLAMADTNFLDALTARLNESGKNTEHAIFTGDFFGVGKKQFYRVDSSRPVGKERAGAKIAYGLADSPYTGEPEQSRDAFRTGNYDFGVLEAASFAEIDEEHPIFYYNEHVMFPFATKIGATLNMKKINESLGEENIPGMNITSSSCHVMFDAQQEDRNRWAFSWSQHIAHTGMLGSFEITSAEKTRLRDNVRVSYKTLGANGNIEKSQFIDTTMSGFGYNESNKTKIVLTAEYMRNLGWDEISLIIYLLKSNQSYSAAESYARLSGPILTIPSK